jgi:hypothetical protein
VREVGTLSARGIVDEVGDVLSSILIYLFGSEGDVRGEAVQTYNFGPRQILKICAPGPNSYGIISMAGIGCDSVSPQRIRCMYQEQQAVQHDTAKEGFD